MKRKNQYEIVDERIICKACFRAGKHEEYADILEAEVITKKELNEPVKRLNPIEESLLMTPEVERDKMYARLSKVETITQLNAEIVRHQEITAALAKHADILHVPLIDKVNNIVLNALTDENGEDALRQLVQNTIQKGDVKGLRMLLAGLKDLNDMRESWLAAFDQTRVANKPHTKVQVLFSGNNVGVNIEN